MAISINLLKNRHTLSEKEYKQEQSYFRYAMMATVLVVVITLAVSIWQFILTRQLDKVEQEITQSTSQMQTLSEANARQIYLKSRLRLITAFLDDRAVSRQALQSVFSIDLPDVIISGASFESDDVLKIQATARSVESFNALTEYVASGNDFFIQVVSEGVNRLQDGSYQMNLLLTIPKS